MRWLILQAFISFRLDFDLLFFCPALSLQQRLEVILKKYLIAISSFSGLQKFVFGKTKTRLFGRDLFFEEPRGIFRYQSILARHLWVLREQKSIGNKNINIVDVGANVGYFTRAALFAYPDAKVISIDPAPPIIEVLKKNLSDVAKNIEIHQTALGAYESNVKIKIDSTLLAETRVDKDGDVEVKMTTLDRLIADRIDHVDILKIDVEGYEHDVLLGAKSTLAKTRFLLLEVARSRSRPFSETISLLNNENFKFDLRSIINYQSPGSRYQFGVADLLFENVLLNPGPLAGKEAV